MTPGNQITNSMSMRSSFKTEEFTKIFSTKKIQKMTRISENPEISKKIPKMTPKSAKN